MTFANLTIQKAIKGLLSKEFSARALVEFYLGRIKKLNPQVNAFLTVCDKEAVREAGKIDKLLRRSSSQARQKLLLGIPVGIKDVFCTKDVRTTAASKILENYVPVYDATVVTRLRQAGAIILGKTNMDAWAHGSSGENSDFGATRNPWNLQYVPGGTSSGSAAAVAADMCLAAIGSDTGGSIRQPASFCNIVGLKPTYGRVSRYGLIANASSLDAVGHLTKTVEDTALLLNVMAGFDGKDATCPRTSVPDYTKDLHKGMKGVKVGIPREYLIEGIDQGVEARVQEAARVFRQLGAEVVEVSLPHTKYANAAYYIIQPSETSSNLARYDGVRYGFSRDQFGDEAKRRIMLGTYTLSAGYYEAYYLKAMKVRTLIRKDFEQVFKRVDCLLAPVSPTPPFKLGEKVDDPLKMYLSDIFTVTINLAGLPALAVPAGFVDGLPVGVQIIGPQFSEDLLLRVGFAFEEETKYHQNKPAL